MRCCAYTVAFCVVTYVVIGLAAHPAIAAVKSASSDGEATVYLMGKFSTDFDVVYRAALKPAGHNKSWSSLSILLVGTQIPGPGASRRRCHRSSAARARASLHVRRLSEPQGRLLREPFDKLRRRMLDRVTRRYAQHLRLRQREYAGFLVALGSVPSTPTHSAQCGSSRVGRLHIGLTYAYSYHSRWAYAATPHLCIYDTRHRACWACNSDFPWQNQRCWRRVR